MSSASAEHGDQRSDEHGQHPPVGPRQQVSATETAVEYTFAKDWSTSRTVSTRERGQAERRGQHRTEHRGAVTGTMASATRPSRNVTIWAME